jgi:predicted  nucleic acid-binding Zn-ribbon protein
MPCIGFRALTIFDCQLPICDVHDKARLNVVEYNSWNEIRISKSAIGNRQSKMSQPEISHRCSSCGVSIREFSERAMFCPECGKPLQNTAATTSPEDEPSVGTHASGVQHAQVEIAGPSKVAAPAEVSSATTPDPDSIVADPLSESEVVRDSLTEKPRHGARERARETLHRASNVARGAIEDNVKRVEKIHHVSSAMFEEATYDPSLRFVLVALGLFVVFIILLILSKVMG